MPLRLKDPEKSNTTLLHRIAGKKLQHVICKLQEYVAQSLDLSRKCEIIKIDMGFILDRKPVHQELEALMNQYEQQITKLRPADFVMIRLEFVLAKLRTYLGLTRISEFSISKEQWLDWHEHETQRVLAEIMELLIQIK